MATRWIASRRWHWTLLALALTAVALLVLALAWGGRSTERAEAQTPSVSFSIEVNGGFNSCSTRPGANTVCKVGLGSRFTVGVNLDAVAGLAGNAYGGVQARLNYSPGLTLKNRPEMTEIFGVWPDCFFDAENKDTPQSYLVGCVVNIGGSSTYIGRVVEVDFTCPNQPAEETVTLVHGDPLATEIVDPFGIPVVEAGAAAETLAIRCVEAPPTPTPTPTPSLHAQFSIGVAGGLNACSTRPNGNPICEVARGRRFTVGVHLDEFAGLPGGGYAGVQARVNFSGGLTLKNRPEKTEISGVWPDCAIDAENKGTPNSYLAGCIIGIGAPLSSYTGRVVEVDLTCPDRLTEETVTLVHGTPTSTAIVDVNAALVSETSPSETLTVRCVEPPFPWDMDGDGAVTIADIFDVARHFGERKAGAGGGVRAALAAGLQISLLVKGSLDCTGPTQPSTCAVARDRPFQINVVASAPPPGGFAGFQSEVFLGGLIYQQQARCEDEVLMQPLDLCLGPAVQLGGQVVHGGLTAPIPPLLKSNSFQLVTIHATCPGQGSFKVSLTAYPDSPFGAMYALLDGGAGSVKPVGQQDLDLNGDTVAGRVSLADTLTINCVDAPPPTLTPTPTPTPVPRPFPWDLDGDGAVTIADVFAVARHFGETRP